MNKCSLTKNERETIISWNDSDNSTFFIYSTQQPMIKKILRNPYFKIENKRYNLNYSCHPNPISIEGYMPIKCLTIRTKLRHLTKKQKQQQLENLRKARKKKIRTKQEV